MDNQTTTEREIENQLISAGITLKLGRVELLEYITKLIAQEKADLLEKILYITGAEEYIRESQTLPVISTMTEEQKIEHRTALRIYQQLVMLAHSQVVDTEERSEDREGKE